MNRSACCTVAALAFVLSLDAAARMRPSFDAQYAAWHADQIVVVRVGGTFEVIETWHGDLKPGDQLELPSVGSMEQATYAKLTASRSAPRPGMVHGGAAYAWARRDPLRAGMEGFDLRLLEGSRAIFFLRDKDNSAGYFLRWTRSKEKPSTPFATLLPDRERGFSFHNKFEEVIPPSVAWVFEGRVYSLAQLDNPGPPVPWCVRQLRDKRQEEGFSEDQLKQEVLEVVAIRKAFDAVSAEEDLDTRVQAIAAFDHQGVGSAHDAIRRAVADYATLLLQRAEAMADQKAAETMLLEFVKSDSFVPAWGVVESFAKGGKRAVPALIHILDQPEWDRLQVSVIRALAAVNSPELGGEFVKRLEQETEYWQAKAKQLSPGWLQALSSDNKKQYREL